MGTVSFTTGIVDLHHKVYVYTVYILQVYETGMNNRGSKIVQLLIYFQFPIVPAPIFHWLEKISKYIYEVFHCFI